MKLLQINTVVNSGSTGRIAENIGRAALAAGHKTYIAAAYTSRPSQSEVITIGSDLDRKLHGLKTILLDRHGFGSAGPTKALIKKISEIQPDVIQLHNIHGYYLNIEILFAYLKQAQIPVVWTFHDCWPFTGHCSFFDRVHCSKWQTECNHCPNLKGYPASLGLDQSKRNFHDKRSIFTGVKQLQIVTPSKWLANHVQHSFLSAYPVQVIHNGVDTRLFAPAKSSTPIFIKYELNDQPILLGVASTWDRRKGLEDFIQLSNLIADVQILLVGLNKEQIKELPEKIKGMERTENSDELAALYSVASVFVNPTTVDNFPTTNIEALACGTPVITYKTGGSPEAVDEATGFVVEKKDIKMLAEKVRLVLDKGKDFYRDACRKRALQYFNKDDRYADYLDLYQQLLSSDKKGNSNNQQSLKNIPAG